MPPLPTKDSTCALLCEVTCSCWFHHWWVGIPQQRWCDTLSTSSNLFFAFLVDYIHVPAMTRPSSSSNSSKVCHFLPSRREFSSAQIATAAAKPCPDKQQRSTIMCQGKPNGCASQSHFVPTNALSCGPSPAAASSPQAHIYCM